MSEYTDNKKDPDAIRRAINKINKQILDLFENPEKYDEAFEDKLFIEKKLLLDQLNVITKNN